MFRFGGPGSSVGIVTDYGLDGPGIEYRLGRDFSHTSRPALGPNQPPVQWVPGLSRGVECGRGVTLTTHPPLAPRSRMSRAIPLIPSRPLLACYRVTFTFYMFRFTSRHHQTNYITRSSTRRHTLICIIAINVICLMMVSCKPKHVDYSTGYRG
jgi:hypothetical protein